MATEKERERETIIKNFDEGELEFCLLANIISKIGQLHVSLKQLEMPSFFNVCFPYISSVFLLVDHFQ